MAHVSSFSRFSVLSEDGGRSSVRNSVNHLSGTVGSGKCPKLRSVHGKKTWAMKLRSGALYVVLILALVRLTVVSFVFVLHKDRPTL